jgi:hypothetical protein
MDQPPGRIAMHKFSVLVAIMLVAATLVPAVRSNDAASVAGQMSGDWATSAPVILAQGRCFNGRCF